MNDFYKALEIGNEELVLSLIEGGIDVNKTDDKDEFSPLLWLVFCMKAFRISNEELQKQRYQCQFRILNMLIHAGADINATMKRYGHNALHIVFQENRDYDIKMVEVLLKHGCDVNATYHCSTSITEGTSILHLALERVSYTFVNGNAELIKLLLNYGADANIKDSYGWNAIESYLLSHASDGHDYSLGSYRGINPNIVKLFSLDNIDMSPLHRSSIFDEYDDFCELASKPGVDVNAVDKLENTPLLYAVFLEHNDLSPEDKKSKIKLLLSLGADVSRTYKSYKDNRTYRIIDLPLTAEFETIYWFLVQGTAVQSVISGDEYELINMFDICVNEVSVCAAFFRELKEMMRYLLIDDISMYDVLVANSTESAMYAKNKQLVKVLETSMSEERFPIYQEWLLHTNFGLALERRKLLEPAAIKLCSILKFADPTDEFYEKTLSYLSTRDLKVLLGLKRISVKDLIMRESLLDCSS